MNNSETIITTSVENITMSSQFLKLTTPNGELEIDIKKLLKEPINSDSAYFNATTIAKMYGVRLDQVFRTREWKSILSTFDQYFPYDATIVKRGRHHSGTWVSISLLAEYLQSVLPIQDYLHLKFTNQLSFSNRNIDKKSIYIIQSDNLVKVGISANPEKRFNQIKNTSGRDIDSFIFTDKLSEAYKVEQFLLAYFDDYRVNGEWLKGVEFKIVVKKMIEILNRLVLNETLVENNRVKFLEEK